MTLFIIISPDPEIMKFEADGFETIYFYDSRGQVYDLDPELHALLMGAGFAVTVEE